MDKLFHDFGMLLDHSVMQDIFAILISKAENFIVPENLLFVDLEHQFKEIVPVLSQGLYQRRLSRSAIVLESKGLAQHFRIGAVALNVVVELKEQLENLGASLLYGASKGCQAFVIPR